MRRTQIGFVVIDGTRASPQLRAFAVQALKLQRVDGEGALDLYVPSAAEVDVMTRAAR